MKGRPVSIKIKLKRGEGKKLKTLLQKPQESHQRARRARILLELDDGNPPGMVAKVVGVSQDTVIKVRRRYLDRGLEQALEDAPRNGRPRKFTQKQRQQIVALACSTPPEGAATWTCRLLMEEVIKRKIVKDISDETIRLVLECHELKPWREKNVVRSRA